GIGEVLEFDPIAAGSGGVAHRFIDDDRQRIYAGISRAGRAAGQVAGTPGDAVAERVARILRRRELTGGGIADDEGISAAVGDRVPVLLIVEVQELLVDRAADVDVFAVVAE